MVARSVGFSVGRPVGIPVTGNGVSAGSGGGGYVVIDSDAATYITAVETADGQSLEDGVKEAIDVFVAGCKTDGIWADLTDSVLLAGARTLSGALVPLRGATPTNNNFVSGDYSRTGGLTGNGSTKFIEVGKNDNEYAQNDYHQSLYISTIGSAIAGDMGMNAATGRADSLMRSSTGLFRGRTDNLSHTHSETPTTGLIAFSRASSTAFSARLSGVTDAVTQDSVTVDAGPRTVFALTASSTIGSGFSQTFFYDGQIAFYSLGTAIDLAALDTRVSTLITAIGTALA